MVTVLYSSVLMKIDRLVTFNNQSVKLLAICDDNTNSVNEDIAVALKQPDFGKLLIVYPTLESAMFHAAKESVEPLIALNQWYEFIKVAINLVKRNRNISHLISDQSLLKHHKELDSLFDDQLFASHSILPDTIDIPYVFKLIADKCLDNDPALKRIAHQAIALECVTAEFNQLPLASFLSSVSQEWVRVNETIEKLTTERAEHQTSLRDTNEENQLLLEQLHLVQETLEEKLIDQQSMQDQKTILIKQLSSCKTKTNKLLKNEQKLNAEIVKLMKELKLYKVNYNHLQSQSSNKSLISKFTHHRRLLKQTKMIELSPLFNAEWYLNKYHDVAEHPSFKSRPALHYLQIGGFEGRNPSADFDSERYLVAYKDVELQQVNPLLHYILHGETEGRNPRP